MRTQKGTANHNVAIWRGQSDDNVAMFGMSRRRQTLSKSIRDHQISAERHKFAHLLVDQIPDEIAVNSKVCCLLVLNSVTSTPQWILQPEAA